MEKSIEHPEHDAAAAAFGAFPAMRDRKRPMHIVPSNGEGGHRWIFT
jgi:hypothetical protein